MIKLIIQNTCISLVLQMFLIRVYNVPIYVVVNAQILSLSTKKNAPKFLETLLFSIIVLLNIYLLFKNNSLQIKFVVDKKYFSMVHLMPMQILTDVKHELNVKFSAYAQYLFFRVVYRFRIWFVSKKLWHD